MSLALLLPDMPVRRGASCPRLDFVLLAAVAALFSLGLVMVASASMPVAERLHLGTFHFALRQTLYLFMGLALGVMTLRIKLAWWEQCSRLCILVAILLLAAVLLPGLGTTVNGSTRWIDLGVFRLQVSEPAKLLALIYMAGYLVRHADNVRETRAGFIKPLGLIGLAALLLLLEPDFGTTVVLMSTVLVMMFMAGVSLWKFGALIAVAGGAFALLAVSSPYRMQRLTAFLNPWDDPFNSGFQLTQSLMAIGRGEWFGVGLGAASALLSAFASRRRRGGGFGLGPSCGDAQGQSGFLRSTGGSAGLMAPPTRCRQTGAACCRIRVYGRDTPTYWLFNLTSHYIWFSRPLCS